ncbi:MAG TPA: EamA family transporter, partial [Patescibacteria group bacterium]|nr:EamA family transporter [Patescibacteria group bacterium]
MSGYLLAILAFIIWGFTSSVILRSVPLAGPAASEAGCIIGSVALFAIIGPKRWPDVGRLFRRYPLRLFCLAAAFGCCSLTYQWAVKTTTVANAVLTHSFQPILTCLLFVPLWGGAKPTGKGYAALALGMSGLAILIGPQLSWHGSTFETAAGMALGA